MAPEAKPNNKPKRLSEGTANIPSRQDDSSPERAVSRDTTVPVLAPRSSSKSRELPLPKIKSKSKHNLNKPFYEPPSQDKCKSFVQKFCKFLYNKKKKTFCDRTCKSWLMIIAYSIIYLISLATFMMILLYIALSIIKSKEDFGHPIVHYKGEHYGKFIENAVGLHITPVAETEDAQIRYKSDKSNEYQRYINKIANLLARKTKHTELINALGPCGKYPYGYGDSPCVIARIDEYSNWSGQPLHTNSTLMEFAPQEVRQWVRTSKKMLWLHCHGDSPDDKKVIGKITYHPYPPGIDAEVYPLGDNKELFPLLAVQFSNFKKNVVITVVCRLWYEHGPSSAYFTLNVEQSTPQVKVLNNVTKLVLTPVTILVNTSPEVIPDTIAV